MATGTLTIDLDALARNWRALDSASGAQTETGAVVKADAYGLGAGRVARRLAQEGVRRFFVAVAEEGATLRQALGPGPEILVLGGHMRGDTDMIADLDLVPMLNSIDQLTRHFEALPGHAFGVQLDTGMNRLGLEPAEWAAVREIALPRAPRLVMSHLACADDPEHPMNAAQLALFRDLTDGIDAPRSLSATGGILLGDAYHFDLTRPGVGLYGGEPFLEADPVAWLSVPVIQIREVQEGETVGYGNGWTAPRDVKLATIAAGYADGLIRAASRGGALAFSRGQACPIVGRISMDLITVEVGGLDHEPDSLDLLCAEQTVDDLAAAAGTIGYEVLTALGQRYHRRYRETGA
ncbi:alanine racemase [Palleronia sp. KMU-117]|uniref:alanine racemase n=1 Tax=Palleronia sp. KMU-117 TaxID=3434108 RepID=UPI003D73ED46